MPTRPSRRPPGPGHKERSVAIPPRRPNLGARGGKAEKARGGVASPVASTSGIKDRKPTQRQQPRGRRQSGVSQPDTQQKMQAAKQPKMEASSPQNQQASSRSMRMTDWLKKYLNSGEVPGLRWEDVDKGIFKIIWIHKSSQAFDEAEHMSIFQRWANFRGQMTTDPTQLKANFRCALNSLKDVEQLTREGAKRGPEAKRTFRFLSPSDPKYGRNRKKTKTASPDKLKGKKVKKSGPAKKRRSQTSSRSNSSTSAQDSSSSSAPTSPHSYSFGDPGARSPVSNFSLAQIVPVSSPTEESMHMDGDYLISTTTSTTQVEWTANYLLPIMGQTYSTDAKGITSVNIHDAKTTSTLAKEEPEAAESISVHVKPQLQSGATMSRLPNFSELGVQDTYTSEKVLTNNRLGCGGNVKVREEKPQSLPIILDMPLVSEESHKNFKNSSVSSLPPGGLRANVQLDGLEQTDLDVGRYLEVSDTASTNQENGSEPNYLTFTPPETDGTCYLPPVEAGERRRHSSEVDPLQPAVTSVSEALATLNNNHDTMGPPPDFLIEEADISHNGNMRLPDLMFSQTEEDFQDLFQMGAM